MAGGLVVAIMVAVVALSTLGLARSSTKPAVAATAQKPIVHTITKTITIHRKAPAPKPGGAGSSGSPVLTRVVAVHSSTSGSMSTGGFHESDDHETNSGGSGSDD
jgi:hypothetical protein